MFTPWSASPIAASSWVRKSRCSSIRDAASTTHRRTNSASRTNAPGDVEPTPPRRVVGPLTRWHLPSARAAPVKPGLRLGSAGRVLSTSRLRQRSTMPNITRRCRAHDGQIAALTFGCERPWLRDDGAPTSVGAASTGGWSRRCSSERWSAPRCWSCIGDGVVAGVLLNKSKAQNSGWIVITWAWAMGVLVGVFAQPGGHGRRRAPEPGRHHRARGRSTSGPSGPTSRRSSPASSSARSSARPSCTSRTSSHWAETEDPGLKLAVFCTGPAIRNTGANLITEIIGTVHAAVRHPRARPSGVRRPGLAAWRCWSWASACRSVDRPATRSTRRATSDRASCTSSCRSPARATRTGRTRGSRSSARSSAASIGALVAKAAFDL